MDDVFQLLAVSETQAIDTEFKTMEQCNLIFFNNCLNTNIYFYLGGQSSNLYVMLLIFATPVLIRHLWQHKTVVFLHWCIICIAPLPNMSGKRWVLLPADLKIFVLGSPNG